MKNALTPNTSHSVLEDLVQAMQKKLEELASLNGANRALSPAVGEWGAN